MEIVIAGAGIGGLTTALALRKKGFDPYIVEQASEIKPVGAGIILAHNATQVANYLGVYDDIERQGEIIRSLDITDNKLREISKNGISSYDARYGVSAIAIQRPVLHKILSNQIPPNRILWGQKIVSVHQENNRVVLDFEGHTSTCKQLIGADGIHSIIRKSIFPFSALRDAKQACWRGVCSVNHLTAYKNRLTEAWGKDKRFGFVSIGDNTFYWYALITANTAVPQYSKAELINEFAGFEKTVMELITSTEEGRIIRNDIMDLKLIQKWFMNNVCLLGDAAHATTPNLGQGACQAMEDAYVLAEYLQKYSNPVEAFEHYQNTRIKKAQHVVNTSWLIGKLAHLENSFFRGFRNMAIRCTPERVKEKQNEYIFSLQTIQ